MPAKNFLIYSLIVSTLIGLCGCSTGGAFTRKENEYYQFCRELNNDRKCLIRGKTLCEVEPSFWEGAKTAQVTLHKPKIIAIGVGDIDVFETTKGGLASGLATVIMSGVNVAGAVGTAASLLFSGPARGRDTAFQREVEKFVDSYDWQLDDYFFQAVRKGTTLPLGKDISDDFFFLFNRFGEKMEKPMGGKNAIVFLHFMIMPSSMEGWLEPKYRLLASAGITVATDEAIEAFRNKFSKDPFYSQMYIDKKGSGKELRRAPTFLGMYMGSVYKHSAYYTKKEWLSGKGTFLENQLRSAITYMSQETDKLFFPVSDKREI